jgi:hypothetical protein
LGRAYAARVIDVDPELVRGHLAKLVVSEQLGKSETCRKLASYLVERALRDEVPKETEIALDVFGKDPSFNGAEHSIVRVSVRTLRQKLAEYYAGPGRDEELRFEIPKGGYRLTATRHAAATPIGATAPTAALPAAAAQQGISVSPDVPVPLVTPAASAGSGVSARSRRLAWAVTAALMLLAASLLLNIYQWNNRLAPPVDPALAQVRASPVWADIVTSERPVTVILGDLFMFTQLDPKTGRTITVRDAGINSSEELRAFLASNPSFATERGQRYVTMIQKTVAVGMASILRIVDRPGRRIEVAARDDVPVDEIRNNDIIYLGPLVRLGPLTGHYETRSRYRYSAEGATITDVSSGKVFLPEGVLSGQHLDYALAAKFIGPTGNHILIFTSGARNAGLLQIVRTLTTPQGLANVEQRLRNEVPSTKDSFEALLTVTGFKQTDIAADVVALHPLPAVAPHFQKTAAAGG